MYLLNWYDEISDSLNRVIDGVAVPIPWTEYLAWAQVTETLVRPEEYAILRKMDLTYCNEMNTEISDLRLREMEKSKIRK